MPIPKWVASLLHPGRRKFGYLEKQKRGADEKLHERKKMTASQIAAHFSGKKIGRGKWIARCTAHPDKHPSLHITEGKTGVLLSCMSNQCNFLDIVRSAGLKPLMLRYDYDPDERFDTEQIRALRNQRRLEALYERERRIRDLNMVLSAIDCKWKPVRTKTRFECDIERFCAKLQP